MTIIDRIFATLQAKGLTLESFAEKIGVTSGAISKWKTDLKNPPYKRMDRIAEVLGVTKEFLLTGEGDTAAKALLVPPPVLRMEANDGEVDRLRRLTESQQETIILLSKQIASLSRQLEAATDKSQNPVDTVYADNRFKGVEA